MKSSSYSMLHNFTGFITILENNKCISLVSFNDNHWHDAYFHGTSDDETETGFYNSIYVILYITTCKCVSLNSAMCHLKGRI